MIIRIMLVEDCPSVVRIHLRSFQGFFLTFLGPSFLVTFYRSILADSSGICHVAETNKQICGFVAGSITPDRLYRRFLGHHLIDFACSSVGAFIRRPTILPRLLRAFTKPGERMPMANCATLLSIAVDPESQGKGVGKALLEAFITNAISCGVDYVNLTTDAEDNENVNRFYRSNGFTLFRRFITPEGRVMNEYLMQIPKSIK